MNKLEKKRLGLSKVQYKHIKIYEKELRRFLGVGTFSEILIMDGISYYKFDIGELLEEGWWVSGIVKETRNIRKLNRTMPKHLK